MLAASVGGLRLRTPRRIPRNAVAAIPVVVAPSSEVMPRVSKALHPHLRVTYWINVSYMEIIEALRM